MYERYRRKRSVFGSFFSGASGVLVAVLLFFVAAPIALCGGCTVWMATMVEVAKDGEAREVKRTGDVEAKALEVLKSYGITELAKDIAADRTGPVRRVSGKAKDAQGRLHDVAVEFAVAQFSGEVRWEVKSIVIDGEAKTP